MSKLSYKQREKLLPSEFAMPDERKYPIPDVKHGRNALARVSASGTPKEKKMVRMRVHRKFPSIDISDRHSRGRIIQR